MRLLAKTAAKRAGRLIVGIWSRLLSRFVARVRGRAPARNAA